MCEIDIGNLKYTQNTLRLFSSGMKLFITFELKGFWHEERDTIFLYWLLLHCQLSTQPMRGAHSTQIRLASPSSESRLSRSEAGTQLTDFFQISKSSAHNSGHVVIHTPSPISYLGFLLWHLRLSHSSRVCVNTCTQLTHTLTKPCTKQKVLSLTKPKGKIYKTKNNHIKKIPPQLYKNIWA